jgi:hypothetical protein
MCRKQTQLYPDLDNYAASAPHDPRSFIALRLPQFRLRTDLTSLPRLWTRADRSGEDGECMGMAGALDHRLRGIWWWGKARRRVAQFVVGYFYWCGAPYFTADHRDSLLSITETPHCSWSSTVLDESRQRHVHWS